MTIGLVGLAIGGFPAMAGADHGGVSQAAGVLCSIGGFSLTDSMVFGWLISIAVVVAVRFTLRGGVRLVPSTGQAVIESIVGGQRSVVEPIVGKGAIAVAFPCLIGYFFFILVQNVGGLLPGVGSIGSLVHGKLEPFLRPANADLNTTLALALVAFFAWVYFCVKCAGVRELCFEVFGNKADKAELSSAMYGFLFVVFLAVGLIECISIACRIISLSFRLFGNTFGGENLLHNVYGFAAVLENVPVVKYLAYLIPLPFYFLEFLIAIIQSFVFTLLVAVYVGLVCNHDGDHGDEPLKGK